MPWLIHRCLNFYSINFLKKIFLILDNINETKQQKGITPSLNKMDFVAALNPLFNF